MHLTILAVNKATPQTLHPTKPVIMLVRRVMLLPRTTPGMQRTPDIMLVPSIPVTLHDVPLLSSSYVSPCPGPAVPTHLLVESSVRNSRTYALC